MIEPKEMVIRSAFGWVTPRQREDFLLFTLAVEQMATHHADFLADFKASTQVAGTEGSVAPIFQRVAVTLRTTYLTFMNRIQVEHRPYLQPYLLFSPRLRSMCQL